MLKSFQVDADCIWYGECGPSTGDNVYNCKYLGPAIQVTNSTMLDMIRNLCPHLYHGDEATFTCCDFKQLKRFSDDLSVPKQLMSRCPACYLNFRTLLCDLTCGPTQNEFLMITQEQPYTPNAPKPHDEHTQDQEEAEPETQAEDQNNEETEENDSKRRKRDLSDAQQHDPSKTATEEVVRLTYFLTNYFVNNLYNACK